MKNILLILFLIPACLGLAQVTCPTADFNTIGPHTICSGESHVFSVSGPQGMNFSVSWQLPDGSSSSEKVVTYTSEPGSPISYTTVTVTVNQAFGAYQKGYSCKSTIQNFPCLELPPIVVEVIPPGNPFLTGEEGNWRVKRDWLLHVERNQTRGGTNDNVNLRTDGTYKKFYSFWTPSSTEGASWIKQNESKWTFKTQINYYNPFGTFELENVDPLNRYSAAVYGYNRSLPVAVASNARYREIAFDSFEDYDYGRCENNHFSFQFVNGIEDMIDESNSHSGRKSIRVGADQTVTMKKQFAKCPEEEKPVIVR